VNRQAYSVEEDHSAPVQPTDMDERIVLPAGSATARNERAPAARSGRSGRPGHFQHRGSATDRSASRQKTKPNGNSQRVCLPSRFTFCCSLRWRSNRNSFPPMCRPQAEIELAQRQLTPLLPPWRLETLKPSAPPAQPAPKSSRQPARVARSRTAHRSNASTGASCERVAKRTGAPSRTFHNLLRGRNRCARGEDRAEA